MSRTATRARLGDAGAPTAGKARPAQIFLTVATLSVTAIVAGTAPSLAGPAAIRWVQAPAASPPFLNRGGLSTGNMTCRSTTDCTVAGYVETVGATPSAPPQTYHAVIWHWGGSAWSLQPTGVIGSAALVDTACSGASSCWTVGARFVGPKLESTIGLIEHRSGAGWVPAAIPKPAGVAFNGIDCASASVCVAVGERQVAADKAVALVYVWDGSTWTERPAPSPPGAQWSVLDSVHCSRAASCIALGTADDSATGPGYFFGERSGGTSFGLVRVPSPTPFDTGNQSGLYGLSCAGTTSCLAVGGALTYTHGRAGANFPGGVARTWNGVSWTVAPVPSGAEGAGYVLEQDSCLTASDCWVAASLPAILGLDHPAPLLHWDGKQLVVTTLPLQGFMAAVDCLRISTGVWCAALGEVIGKSGQVFMAGGHFTPGSHPPIPVR